VTAVRARGRIKQSPEDFVVEEIPAYAPSGAGSHLYVQFEKRALTTDEAARAIARALGADMREVGIAGLKDKIAVTRQWISVPMKEASPPSTDAEERARALALDGITILDARRHGNKLRTGHLRGNRFTIVVREIEGDADEVAAGFERVFREGVPNAFGAQRFGTRGDTAERARAWLTGKDRAPKDPRKRRFEFSALQSAIFNAVLDERVKEGIWNVPIDGDLLKKEETGGMFVCTDVQLDRERAASGEVWPTGPIVGDRMRQPEREARLLEERITQPLLEGIDLHRARSLGEGTRRTLGFRVSEPSITQVMKREIGRSGPSEGPAIEVRFVLPKGAYATTVLGSVLDVVEGATTRPNEASFEAELRTEEE
jgi:tRNA pseudouridine13 synthase